MNSGESSRLSNPATSVVWLPVIIFIVLFAIEFSIILKLNNGLFVYTLDDAYIHLALAENVANGHYGINSGEYSAPSSSIIWPFLLAPFSKLSIDYYVPIVINFFASIGTILLFNIIIASVFRNLEAQKKRLISIVIVVLLIPVTNIIGIAFNGMENSLQLFFSVLLVYGLLCERETKTVSWWLLLAIILGPLLRFENLALSVPALGYLAWRQHFKAFILSGIILVAALASFSLFLHSKGLGFIPSSILAKSAFVMTRGSIMSLLLTFKNNLSLRQCTVLSIGLFIMIYAYLVHQLKRDDRLLAIWIIIATILHLLLGNFGHYNRYEIYIWASLLLMILYIYRNILVRFIELVSFKKVVFLLCVLAGIISTPYFSSLISTPNASNNIYEQHYQMHRFITEYYKGDVAVNDIGWVSYHNSNYILDLWGLGSLEALINRKNGKDPSWIKEMVEDHDIKLIMIYDSWFDSIPDYWISIGTLHLGKEKITPGEATVRFYAVDTESETRVKILLDDYVKTLPKGVQFRFPNDK